MKRIKYGRALADGSRTPYYRHPDGKFTPLPRLPENHPDFLAAYAEAAAGKAPERRTRRKPDDGTLADLVDSYEKSVEWRALSPNTRAQRRRIASLILSKPGKTGQTGADVRVSSLTRRAIEGDLESFDPHPARNRLKVWRALMAFAKARGKIDTDPTEGIRLRKAPKTGGHIPWTLGEIARFRAHHAYGTEARLAMELCFWTAGASADAVRLGVGMVTGDGWLVFARQKTGTVVEIPMFVGNKPLAPELAEDHAHLMAALAHTDGRQTWLLTAFGEPRSAKAFGSWMAGKAQEAGLPVGRTPHGLRKSRLIVLAEMGWSQKQLMKWAGHLSPQETALYIERAEARRLLARGTFGETWNTAERAFQNGGNHE